MRDPAVVDSRSWTFAELACVARKVARALLTRFEPGDRVAVWSPVDLIQLGSELGSDFGSQRLCWAAADVAGAVQTLEKPLSQSKKQRGLGAEPLAPASAFAWGKPLGVCSGSRCGRASMAGDAGVGLISMGLRRGGRLRTQRWFSARRSNHVQRRLRDSSVCWGGSARQRI